MARSRNIKPGFFLNDDLAEISPLGRLVFIGLWTIADFRGNLEYRPKKIKAQIIPYDDSELEPILSELIRYKFIHKYSDGEKEYLSIKNFEKHQNPHKNEKQSGTSIPSMEECAESIENTGVEEKDGTRTEQGRNKDGTTRADSLLLIPDSLDIEDTPPQPKKKRFTPPTIEQCIEHCGNKTESEKFILFYESKGWMVGKNKMVNWKSALTRWMKNNYGNNNQVQNNLDEFRL